MTNVASMLRQLAKRNDQPKQHTYLVTMTKLRNLYVHVQKYPVDTLVMLLMILALVYIGMILSGRHPATTLVVIALSLNTTYED